MTGTILPFPRDAGHEKQTEGKSHWPEVQLARKTFVESIRLLAADTKRKFKERDDQIGPAQLIDQLIIEAKKRKIKQSSIAEALRARGLPIRHLERLRVDYRIHRSERSKIAEEAVDLRPFIHPYVTVLEILADLLSRSANDVIFDAFRHTSYWQPAAVSPDDPTVTLTFLLHEMAQSIVQKERLPDFFAGIRKMSGRYDLTFRDFVPGFGTPMRDPAYEDNIAVWEEAPPFPSCPILLIPQASFLGPLIVESTAFAASDLPQEAAARLMPALGHRSNIGATEVVSGQVSLSTEVRLSIGPMARPDDIGPLLESRSYVQLTTNGGSRPLTLPFSLWQVGCSHAYDGTFDPSVAACFMDGWKRIAGFGDEGWVTLTGEHEPDPGLLINDVFGYAGADVNYYLKWAPVNSSTVHQLMQILARRETQSLFDISGSRPTPIEFGFGPYRCQLFETALATGAIEAALLKEARELREKLSIRLQNAKENRQSEIRNLVHHWRRRVDD